MDMSAVELAALVTVILVAVGGGLWVAKKGVGATAPPALKHYLPEPTDPRERIKQLLMEAWRLADEIGHQDAVAEYMGDMVDAARQRNRSKAETALGPAPTAAATPTMKDMIDAIKDK
jgi:hypothetical protein